MKKQLLLFVLTFICSLSGFGQGNTVLKVTSNGFVNRQNAYIGTQFTRNIDIVNVQNGQFTGYVKIVSNSGSSLSVNMKITPSAKITLVSPLPLLPLTTSPLYTSLGLTLTPAVNNEIILRVTNFIKNTDYILIQEDVTVIGCLAANNTSQVEVSMVESSLLTPPLPNDYVVVQGASKIDLSQTVTKGDPPKHQVTDFTPSHTISVNPQNGLPTPPLLMESDFQCTGDNNFKTMKFSVRLTDDPIFQDAIFHDFVLWIVNNEVEHSKEPTLFSIDQSSIKIEKRSNDPDNHLIPSWLPPIAYDRIARTNDPTSPTCLDASRKFDQLKFNLGDLLPNEHYEIEYDLYNCCKQDTLFDNKIRQSNNFFWYTFKDDCGNFNNIDGQKMLGPNTYSNGKGIVMEAKINASPSHILGIYPSKTYADLANYVIDNPMSAEDYNAIYGGLGAIFKEREAELIIRVKSGPSLRYITTLSTPYLGTYDFINNPGNFSYNKSIAFIDKYNSANVWNPVSPLGTVFSTSPVGYETREFKFKLMDLPGISATSTTKEIFDQFLKSMNTMQLAFTLEGVCSPQDDGNWGVQYLFKISNCSECALPITAVSDLTDVLCPGCKVPGAAVRSNAQRLNYGAFDPNNDDVFVAPETESSVHTLNEVLAYNSSNTDASDDIQTTIASVNDNIVFSNKFYLTAPSDCAPSGPRIACRDTDLQYQWAYLQVKVPENYFDPTIQNLSIQFQRGVVVSTVSAFSVNYYVDPSVSPTRYNGGIFYIKIKASDLGHAYFLSGDAFDVSFNSKIIFNVAQRERHEIKYMAYFTKQEEHLNALQITNPNLQNRSYADCNTTEDRGIFPTCNTDVLQMICETWGSYLTFVSINTNFYTINQSAYTQNKSCLKWSKYNAAGGSGSGEKSNFGNPNGFEGLNLFKNEFRRAPIIQTISVVVPEGYVFKELVLSTWYGKGPNDVEFLSIKPTDANFGLSNRTANKAVGTNRVLVFTNQNQLNYSIANGASNPNFPLHYSDESFQPERFSITLVPDCKYLIEKPITQTDLGNAIINGQKVYSTVTVDNPFVGSNGTLFPIPFLGTNGTFIIGGDNAITQTPMYNPAVSKFDVIKLNALGSTFPLQKKSSFVNEFEFKQKYNNPSQIDDYDGKVYFAVNLGDIKKFFSTFKVEVIGAAGPVTVIDINASNVIAAGIYPDARPMRIKVTGVLNLSDCTDKLAKYDLIYGIHCNDNDILDTVIVNGITTTTLLTGLCNQWTEHIDLTLDEVDMLLTTNVTSGYPMLSPNTITHEAIFTATRSEITNLNIQLTNTPASTIVVKNVDLVKNTGTSTAVISLVLGVNYTLSPDQSSINIHTLPPGVFFESITTGDDYYNEVHVIFDVVNTSCAVSKIQTTIMGTATPFYSATQCKTVKSATIEAPLTNLSKPVVTIIGETIWCTNEPLVLTANSSLPVPSTATYTWYELVGGIRQLPALFGPSLLNTFTYTNLTQATTIEVELNTGNGCISKDTHLISLLPVDECCTYKLGDVSVVCSTTKKDICIPLTAVRNVPAGIIGMDFCLKYNPAVMEYTGPAGSATSTAALGPVVTRGGIAQYATYNDRVNGVLRVSIYYTDPSTTATRQFSGIGNVICLNFAVLPSTANAGQTYPIAMCNVNDLQEAYTLIEKAACWKAGSLIISPSDNILGKLSNPLYGAPNQITGAGNTVIDGSKTLIMPVDNNCQLFNVATSTPLVGSTFTATMGLATKLKITRDIVFTNSTSPSRAKYLLVVNSRDLIKMHRITTMDPILLKGSAASRVYWYTMVAADVNMNGAVRSNDITLVQERMIGRRFFFPQVWNSMLSVPAESLDWRFVDEVTTINDPSFVRSSAFPQPDVSGFHRERVPNLPLCLAVQKQCEGSPVQQFYGVMLGDVEQSATALGINQPGIGSYLRTAKAPSSLTVDIEHAQYLGNNIYRVPVMHTYNFEYDDHLFGIDMFMDYDQTKIRINNVLYAGSTTDAAVSMMWNNADEDQFILTSYTTLDSIVSKGVSYYLDIEKFTDAPFTKEDFGYLQFLLNGEPVEARITAGSVVTGTTDGQAGIKPHITIIPNPAVGQSTIEFAVSNNSNNNRLVITDVLGRIVRTYESIAEYGMLDLNTNDLAPGMYICTIRGENGFVLTEKFQVRK